MQYKKKNAEQEPSFGNLIPPNSLEVEQSVLASALINEETLDSVMEMVQEEDFYQKQHRVIFSAMRYLYSHEHTVDLLLLSERLKQMESLENVGGELYLSKLVTSISTTTNIEKYVEILRQKTILRRLMQETHEIGGMCMVPEADARETLDVAEQKIFRITDENAKNHPVIMRELLRNTFVELENIAKTGGITGLQTGFTELDNYTTGLHPGELIIVAARPGMGKTAFVLSLASNVGIHAENPRPIALFSLEMPKEQLMHRMLCSEAQVEMGKVRGGYLTSDDFKALADAGGRMGKAPIYIDDSGALSPMEIRAKCRRIKAQQKDLGLIIIDYLQLMHSSEKQESRQLEISSISRTLKEISKELKVPVIALSQLSRNVEQRTGDNRPQLSDLRESGAIEQDADLVLFLYRKAYYMGKSEEMRQTDEYKQLENVAEVIIGKQRNGPLATCELSFVGRFTKFANLDKNHNEPESF